MARKRSKQSTGSWFWYVLLIGLGMVFSPGASTVLALGMMPTLVGMFVTVGHSSGARLMTIGTFNLAGVLPFAFSVGFGEASAGEVLSDIFSWGVMMGAASVGAGLNFIGPILASQVLSNMAASDQRALTKVRDNLVAEWGADVLKSARPAAPPKK